MKKSPSDWKESLAQVLKAHNRLQANGTIASFSTQDKRADVLFAGFKELSAQGYKLDHVKSFRGKHFKVLTKHWEAQARAGQLSASTFQNRISIFRVFANWIGKPGMIESTSRYVSPEFASRSSINRQDKSWQAKGVEIAAKIAEVQHKDARVALQLELQACFGLRAREALQLRPYLADQGSYLAITVGTKGGRERVVPIDTSEKRLLIDRAKTFAASKAASTSDPKMTLAQAKNHYYYVLRSCGISRKQGITGHGLRHNYANDRYQQLSGNASPVRGGTLSNRNEDYVARLSVAEELGHSRESITTHYLGR